MVEQAYYSYMGGAPVHASRDSLYKFNFKKIHCAFLQLIKSIVGRSARAPKMYTLGTYYNLIDTHIKVQCTMMLNV